ncbi:hypothetical protein HOD02_02560 [bacterium]|jgi:hypothetical protein|nr:hypothetical protein [bacterium]
MFLALIIALGNWLYQLVWGWERFWQELILSIFLAPNWRGMAALTPYLDGVTKKNSKKYKTQSNFHKIYVLFSMLASMFGSLVLITSFMLDAGVFVDAPTISTTIALWGGIVLNIIFSSPLYYLSSGLETYNEIEDREAAILDEKKKIKAKEAKAKRKEKSKREKEEKEKIIKEELERTYKDAVLHLDELEKENSLELEKLKERLKKYQSKIEEEKKIILALQKKYPFIGQIVTNRLE